MSHLKNQNYPQLITLMVAPLLPALIFYSIVYGPPSLQDFGILGTAISTIGGALLVVLTDALPPNLKHRLVFMRWRNPLPGHRCNALCAADPRIEPDQLTSRWPEVFGADVSDEARNARWYQQIYKTVQDNPAVQTTHRKFLLYRDATAGTLLLFLTAVVATQLIPQGSTLLPLVHASWTFTGLLLIYYRWNAALYGNRLVVNAVTNATI